MTNIKGQRIVTINADANETYSIDYGATCTVNICNHTGNILVVSDRADYPDDGTASGCLKIAGDAFYNELIMFGGCLYLTPTADGDISIVRIA